MTNILPFVDPKPQQRRDLMEAVRAQELKPHRETVELLASVEKGIREAIEQAECFNISRDRIELASAHRLAEMLLRDMTIEEQEILLRGAVAARIMQTSYFLPLEWPDSEPAA